MCQPDDSFTTDPWTFNHWASSGVFQITMGYGKLKFSQAKAVDVVWDAVVGRGGQALLA
ncbi:hypothetical protein CC86DRAFT_412631 [Ophiobolus disseminans]|uniref:Uncharacterized protein n=1 Tax=Ophiobolus disseminans TaxID=1469910 RepID=A0A6A6ZF03_9PLEO|nr:hypothetical protein CC86DRAFT_412631 [Ophiobolus disseminans]